MVLSIIKLKLKYTTTKLLPLASLLLSLSVHAYSQKYFTQTGNIRFFSKTLIENIEAVNHRVSGILDKEDGRLAFSLLMRSFIFEKALMQEHFNEKYVESDQYPKASFRGTIENFESFSFTEQPTAVNIQGQLTLHGVTQDITVEGLLHLLPNGNIQGNSTFTLNTDDYHIKIPSLVNSVISKQIEITVDIEYETMD